MSILQYRVVVLGTSGVGKSALINQLIFNCFIKKYDPTVEDLYRKQFEIEDDKMCLLEILDTSGDEDLSMMKDHWIKMGEGFILVFSINDSKSFEAINGYREQIKAVKKSDKVPMVIVASKCDLFARDVHPKQVRELIKESGIPFVESSSWTRRGVEDIFFTIIREIRKTVSDKKPESECRRGNDIEKSQKSKCCVL